MNNFCVCKVCKWERKNAMVGANGWLWMVLSFGLYFGLVLYCLVCYMRDGT